MSCTGSCSTDSGVRNPSTVPTLVATGPGGGAGGVSAAGCAAGAEGAVSVDVVSDCGGERRSIGGDAGPREGKITGARMVFFGSLFSPPALAPFPSLFSPPPPFFGPAGGGPLV